MVRVNDLEEVVVSQRELVRLQLVEESIHAEFELLSV